MSEDHFRTLGLQWGASDEEINKAFKKHARTWHPDKNDSTRAQKKYEELSRAKDVLTNPIKRYKWEQEFIRRQGARPKMGALTGLEVALRPDDTVSCVDDESSFDESFSWSSWAKKEDFEKKPEKSTSASAALFEAESHSESFLGSLSTPCDSSSATSSYSCLGSMDAPHGARLSYSDTKTNNYIPSAASDLYSTGSSGTHDHSNKAKPKEMDTLSSRSSGVTIKPKSSGHQFSKTGPKSNSFSTAGLSATKSSGAQVSDTKVKSSGKSAASFTSVSSQPTPGDVQYKPRSTKSSIQSSSKTAAEEPWTNFVENIFKSPFAKPRMSSTNEAPVYHFKPKSTVVETSCCGKSSSAEMFSASPRLAYMDSDDEELRLDSSQKTRAKTSNDLSETRKMEKRDPVVLQLVEMGFPLEACKKAVHVTKNTGMDTALGWLMEHIEDPDFDAPFEEPVIKRSPIGNAPDDRDVTKLMELGFSRDVVTRALEETDNDFDLAVEWILSHGKEPSDAGRKQKDPVRGVGTRPQCEDKNIINEDIVGMLMALGLGRTEPMQGLREPNTALERVSECLFSDDKESMIAGRRPQDAVREPKDVGRGLKAAERDRSTRPLYEARNTISDDNPFQGDSLVRDPGLDDKFQQELERKQDSPHYREMQNTRRKLPVYEEKRNICQTIASNQVTVIEGETGCGKTTQVPQFILDDFIKRGQGSLCRIVCTQPRRISAITVGHRVAHERSERCGGVTNSVGYQIRMESERPRPKASILFCTTGIVLKWLENDPDLSSISHLILDEVHERDLHTDFLLIIMKEVLPRRPDLKLVLMSATLNARQFADYYRTRAGGDCPMLNIPGRTFPVEELFLEDVLELTSYRPKKFYQGGGINKDRIRFEAWLSKLDTFRYSNETKHVVKSISNDRRIDMDLVATLIRHISTKEPAGAILVFMPGMDDITALNDKLFQQQMFKSEDAFLILQLHGSLMSTEQQQRVFDPAPDGVRKIVVSTNIAETSITMDDVVYVIDCGKIKLKNFDAKRNISTLQAECNSKANSQQRKGRAGRVKPGICYHLYTRYHHERLIDQHKPEMLRLRLEDICLQIKLLNRSQGRISRFFQQAMDTIPERSVERSIELLKKLKALDANEELTPLGSHLARLPVDPHLGKMILFGALFGCLDPILTIAACLDYKSPFFAPRKKQDEANEKMRKIADDTCSDHLMFVYAFNGWKQAKRSGNEREYCWDNFLSKETLKTIKKNKQHLAETLCDLGFISERSPDDDEANIHSDNKMLLRAVVCAGLYPNVGTIVTTDLILGIIAHYFKIETPQGEVTLHPKSVNCDQHVDDKYLVYYQKMHTSKVFLHDCTAIGYLPLLLFALDFEVNETADGECDVVIDSFITLEASCKTAQQLKGLRRTLFKVLSEKFDNPRPTNWSPNCNEGKVMLSVVEKISAQKKK